MAIFVTGVVLVLLNVARRCWLTLHGEPIPKEAFGPQVGGGRVCLLAGVVRKLFRQN